MKRFTAMPAVAKLRRLQNALEQNVPGVPATLKDVHEALQRICTGSTERYRQLDAAAAQGSLKATPLVGGASPNSDGDYVASVATPPSALAPAGSPGPIQTAATLATTASSLRPGASNAEAPRCEPLTFFHSRVVPAMPLWSLAKALEQHTSCGEECLLIALVLFSRFCEATNLLPTAHMMHRLYVACLQVGLKAHSDRFPSNKSLARIAGITLQEMNRLEHTLIHGLEWNVQVRRSQVETVIRKIMNAGDDPASPAQQASSSRPGGVDYDVSSAMSAMHEVQHQASSDLSRNPSLCCAVSSDYVATCET